MQILDVKTCILVSVVDFSTFLIELISILSTWMGKGGGGTAVNCERPTDAIQAKCIDHTATRFARRPRFKKKEEVELSKTKAPAL